MREGVQSKSLTPKRVFNYFLTSCPSPRKARRRQLVGFVAACGFRVTSLRLELDKIRVGFSASERLELADSLVRDRQVLGSNLTSPRLELERFQA